MPTDSPASGLIAPAALSPVASTGPDLYAASAPQAVKSPPSSPLGGETAELVAAKLAGRRNASVTSVAEQEALLAERQGLLEKELAGEITKKEAIRLEYVRWSLDKIDDAKYGASLDKLEARIEDMNLLSQGLGAVLQKLDRASHRPGKPRPRR